MGFHADGGVTDMFEEQVIEPRALKRRMVGNAVEAATLLLRVDDVIAATGAEEDGPRAEHQGSASSHETGGYPWAVGH